MRQKQERSGLPDLVRGGLPALEQAVLACIRRGWKDFEEGTGPQGGYHHEQRRKLALEMTSNHLIGHRPVLHEAYYAGWMSARAAREEAERDVRVASMIAKPFG